MIDNKEPTLLTRKQAVEYLRQRNCPLTYGTLTVMAANNNRRKGPPFFKNGNRALYDPAELDLWRKRRLRRIE